MKKLSLPFVFALNILVMKTQTYFGTRKQISKIQYHVGVKLALVVFVMLFADTAVFSQYQIENSVFVSEGKVATNGSTIDVGSYATPTISDVDGDGYLDLLVGEKDNGGRNVNVFLNDKNGAFESNSGTINMSHYTSPTSADIDGDGDMDLCIGDEYGFLKIYTNDGSGNFTFLEYVQVNGVNVDIGGYSSPVYADLDGDGNLELYVGESGGRIKVFTNDGLGNFTDNGFLENESGSTIDVGSRAKPTFADVDGDGDLDLYIGESGGRIRIYTNNGTGGFTSAGYMQTGGSNMDIGSYSAPAFADLNGDGDLDLYIGESGGKVLAYQNTAIHPNIVVLDDFEAECAVTPTAPTALNYAGDTIIGTTTTPFPINNQGTTAITWTYEDTLGNRTTQIQNVIIDDVTAPVPDITNLNDTTVECEITSLMTPTATDNCNGSIAATHDVTLPISGEGTIVLVTWTYDDGNGNTSTQTQNVIIDDTTPPIPDNISLSDISAECEVTSLTAPTATDNCTGTITATHDAALPIIKTTILTWTYNDGNGNTSTQTQNVIINDANIPVADEANLSDISAECEVTSLTAPTATDDCAGAITATHNVTLPIIGTTVITWTYTDGNGNTSTQTQNVIIEDADVPVADKATLSDVIAECEVTILTAPTATDNCAGTITGTHDATLPISTQGTTVVTWTYMDGNRNTSTQTQNVIIDDVTAPVASISSLSDVTAECEVTSLTAPTATDNCAGTITATHDTTLPISGEGTNVLVTWTYDDGNGNTSTQTQNVIIDDITAPVPDIASLSDVTAECEVTNLTAPTANDNCVDTVTATHDATLPISGEGTNVLVTWTYNDGNGNSSTQTQNVIIDDVTAPVPDIASLSDVTAECEVTSLTVPTATDNCSDTITVTHDASLPITTQGTTIVTWTYNDGNGNTSTQTQNVIIDDITTPVADITSLSDVTAECEVTSLTAPTATDNYSDTITVTHDVSLPITTQGTTIVTWTYNDGNGNTSTQTQNVIISDVTAPVADVANLSDVSAECELTSLTVPTATDNCSDTITVTHDATLPIITQGTTVVTWTYSDGNGNTSTQTQNVIIDDVTAPVAAEDSLSDVSTDCQLTSLTAPAATDNCSDTITVTHDATLPITTPGTTVVTWTYNDGKGNTSKQTQNVIITEDKTNPVITSTHIDQKISADANCEAILPDYIASVAASDNCDTELNITQFPLAGTTIHGSLNTVTLTATDDAGNASEVSFNVSVENDELPVVNCADNQTYILKSDKLTYTVSNLDPLISDDCSIVSISNDYNDSNTLNGAEFSVGTTTVNWIITNDAGNTTECSLDITVNQSVEIGLLNSDGVKIYPNPTSGVFNIEKPKDEQVLNVEILSAMGGVVYSKVFESSSEIKIDASEFTQGMYFVKIQTNQKLYTKQIMIK